MLALMFRERGAERVRRALGDAAISAVNHSEVFAKLIDFGMDRDGARTSLAALGLHVEAFGLPDAQVAGELRAVTRNAGLSLGDGACLALARRLQVPVLTADRAWSRCNAGVTVELIR